MCRTSRSRPAARNASALVMGAFLAAACTGGPTGASVPAITASSTHARTSPNPGQATPFDPRLSHDAGRPRPCSKRESNSPLGALDREFVCDWTVITKFCGMSPAYSVAIQSDGKIVAVGGTGMYTVGGDDNNFALARYDRDGTLDPEFGRDGRVATQLRFFQDAHSVAIQDDGMIVVGGSASYGRGRTCSLARYEPDGTPDVTFGENSWAVASGLGTCVPSGDPTRWQDRRRRWNGRRQDWSCTAHIRWPPRSHLRLGSSRDDEPRPGSNYRQRYRHPTRRADHRGGSSGQPDPSRSLPTERQP